MTQAPPPSPPQLRPLGVGETLDAGIKIYRSKFATMLKSVAVVIVPVQVLVVLVTISLPTTKAGNVDANSNRVWVVLAGLLVVLVLTVVASTLAEAACFKAVTDSYLGKQTEWRESLRFGYARLRSLLWLTLIHTMILGLAFLACLVPGIWLYAAWSVAVPALLIEGTRGFKALGRSFDLVRGRWWPTAGTILLANLLVVAVRTGFTIVLLPLTAVGAFSGNGFVSALANGVATAAATVLTIPFVAAVIAVLYFDLRVRKEGFDLQMLAMRIGAPAPDANTAAAPMPWLKPQPGASGGWAPPPPPGWERTPQGARPIEPPRAPEPPRPPSAPPTSPEDPPPGPPAG